jgi:hypothetical protein
VYRLVACAKAYRGLKPLTLSSSISSCCWRTCMKNDSQQFILIPLLQSFKSPVICSAFPYSCHLFDICKAKAYTELFVFMYLICSMCLLFSIYQSVQHEFLLVLYLNLYILVEFFGGTLLLSCVYMIIMARKAMLKLVYLNKLVILCISELRKVNVIYFFF